MKACEMVEEKQKKNTEGDSLTAHVGLTLWVTMWTGSSWESKITRSIYRRILCACKKYISLSYAIEILDLL